MLARFDAAGTLEWTRRYGKGYASTDIKPTSLIELDDGSLLMTGAVATTPPVNPSFAAMTVFFSAKGALTRAKAYTMGPFPGATFFQRVTSFDNAITRSDGTVDLTFAPPRFDGGDGSCSIISMDRSGTLVGLQKLDPLEGLHNNRCLVAPNADRYAIRADTHWFGFSR